MKRLAALLALLLALSTAFAGAGDASVAPRAEGAAPPAAAEGPGYYIVSEAQIDQVIALVRAQAAEIERLKERLAIGGCT